MKNRIFSVLSFLIGGLLFGQETPAESQDIRINRYINGTLLNPASEENPPLVIMIQGSGPTDREGNQSFMKNDSFKKLARGLAEHGIATFRYDKRVFQMQRLGITEAEMRFDDFVTDASTAIDYFADQEKFSNVIVLGHSQGSLVGMLAANDKADAFISIAGAARPIDSILVEQVEQQMPGLKENVVTSFKEMREKGSTQSYDPVLEGLFKPDLQPFMLSWMKYDPVEEIQKLDMPVLIINGTNDLQVSDREAEGLQEAFPEAELVLVENMNHIFREIGGDDLENSKSYNEPGRPLHADLVPVLVDFIKGIE